MFLRVKVRNCKKMPFAFKYFYNYYFLDNEILNIFLNSESAEKYDVICNFLVDFFNFKKADIMFEIIDNDNILSVLEYKD